MDAKLTLSIRPDVIEKAKAWAREQGTSLSAAVEELLEKAVAHSKQKETSLDRIKRLARNTPTVTDEELEQARFEYLTKKHGPF